MRTPQAVPEALVGEWVGAWQSTSEASAGAVTLRVQEFEGEPLVQIDFQNPCIEPRTYELVVTAEAIELRAEGQTVVSATVVEAGRMVGVYNCTGESGTWGATWQRELPDLVDLGGDWSGSLAVAGQVARPLSLVLQQSVRDAHLELDGLLDLGELWPSLLPLRGTVVFNETGFEVLLSTDSGVLPGLLLTGMGDREPLQIEAGLLQTIGSPLLPFQNGVFTITRRGP